jgi:hypothetical protein
MTPEEYARVQELETRLTLIRRQFSRLRAGLIVVEPLLTKPYPDDDRWTPWSRFVAPRLRMLEAAFRGEEMGELAALWSVGVQMESEVVPCGLCGETHPHRHEMDYESGPYA